MSSTSLMPEAFKSMNSLMGKRSHAVIDGKEVPLIYTYKFVNFDGNVQIKIPQELQTYISGDKQIFFRLIKVVDPQFSTSNASQLYNQLRVSVINQRNNYDQNGLQSQVIGYLLYNPVNNNMIGETIHVYMDSRINLQLTIEKLDIASGNWLPFVISTSTATQKPYIYIECEINYDSDEI